MNTATIQNYEWTNTTFGNTILGIEQTALNNILPQFTGNYLVKIGGPKHGISVQASPIKHKIYLTNVTNKSQRKIEKKINYEKYDHVILCDYTSLPLSCESIDIAVVHHALEFEKNPRAILEEIAQVLAPHGHLLIIGFNPKSLFGLQHILHKKSNKCVLCKARLININRITDWLDQLNFSVIKYTTCHGKPFNIKSRMTDLLPPLEKFAQLINNKYGPCYILVAEKNTTTITPIKNRAIIKNLSFGYLKPSVQINHPRVQSL